MRQENQPWFHFAGAAVATSLLFVLVAAGASGSGPQAAKSADAPLRRVADIPLPGPPVRFDYQSLDEEHGRLYIAHMNADQLVVFDIAKREVVANLDGFKRVHGVWAVPSLGRVYASATGDHQVAVVDMKTLATIARAGAINYPDGIAYAPPANRVFVSDEHGNTDAVIDAASNKLIASIPLGGGAGNTVFDPGSGRILVAVHETNELVAIDPATAKIVGRYSTIEAEGARGASNRAIELTCIECYPTTGAKEPHGIALDAASRLAFVAGQGNNTLVVVDLNTMKVLSSHKVGEDPDVLAFDPGLKRLYVSAESGQVAIFQETDRKLVLLGMLSIPHAHTVSVDPKTHLVYFPLENVDGRPLLRIMEPTAP
jgi:DNA-binding beta-propeller fold protein YncE